jgi:hypothetical protein
MGYAKRINGGIQQNAVSINNIKGCCKALAADDNQRRSRISIGQARNPYQDARASNTRSGFAKSLTAIWRQVSRQTIYASKCLTLHLVAKKR